MMLQQSQLTTEDKYKVSSKDIFPRNRKNRQKEKTFSFPFPLDSKWKWDELSLQIFLKINVFSIQLSWGKVKSKVISMDHEEGKVLICK